MRRPVRIANCSGFFGDRPAGAIEMVEGGPIDVLTGDWLAELTMLILHRLRERGRTAGYAHTFLTQMEATWSACLARGIKVVSNAGGLAPAACATALGELARTLGLDAAIAYVDGDDLLPQLDQLTASGALTRLDGVSLSGPSRYLTANAYLGCWGVAEALGQGADIVITGRITDAALTCGPAAWWHGWSRTEWDPLAGAVVAGHVIECSAQATGGNYSFFGEIEHRSNPRFGFPWAEVAADGTSVIGKHDGTGGLVSVGTVTSQLLYEITGPEYLGPDVTARFDSIELEQLAPDRVRITGVRGQPPPDVLKVSLNRVGGYRNSFSVALTGLDIDEKAELAQAAFWDACPLRPHDFEEVVSEVLRTDKEDPASQAEATAVWRLTVKDPDQEKVGRCVSDAVVHTGLSSIPGMYMVGTGPTDAVPYGIFEPGAVASRLVAQRVHLGGRVTLVPCTAADPEPIELPLAPVLPPPEGPLELAALGTVAGARSGDKGGDANLGVFVRSEEAWRWLDTYLTVERLQELLPETAGLPVERVRFPKIRSLNFVIPGLLGVGVAASTRPDPQAKALGEWLRARVVPIPASLLATSASAASHRPPHIS